MTAAARIGRATPGAWRKRRRIWSITFLFDSGYGIDTPTQLRLVQLGQYVQTLQR